MNKTFFVIFLLSAVFSVGGGSCFFSVPLAAASDGTHLMNGDSSGSKHQHELRREERHLHQGAIYVPSSQHQVQTCIGICGSSQGHVITVKPVKELGVLVSSRMQDTDGQRRLTEAASIWTREPFDIPPVEYVLLAVAQKE